MSESQRNGMILFTLFFSFLTSIVSATVLVVAWRMYRKLDDFLTITRYYSRKGTVATKQAANRVIKVVKTNAPSTTEG